MQSAGVPDFRQRLEKLIHAMFHSVGVVVVRRQAPTKTEDLTQAEFILNRLFQQDTKRVDLGPDLAFVVEKQSRSL